MGAEKSSEGANASDASGRRRRKIPRWLIVLGLMAVVAVVCITVFASEIETAIGLDPVMGNIASGLIVVAFLLVWMAGILMFSSLRWPMRILTAIAPLSLPVLFFALLRPVNSGDGLGIHHFEPIWVTKEPVVFNEAEETSNAIDLTPESPYDFPQFMGPDRNNVINNLPALNTLDGTKELWKQSIGEGWSGFSSRNGYAITMEQRDELECVTCYKISSGELVWIYEHEDRHQDMMNLGHAGPRSTPTIHEGKVYSLGANGNFVCLNGASGEVLWQKDLSDILNVEFISGRDRFGRTFRYENSTLAWGHAGSPLIVDDKVIVPGGGARNGDKTTLIAFNKADGEIAWTGGTDMIAYGSPQRATIGGVDQIVIVAETVAAGYAVEDGRQLWSQPREGSSEGAANCSQVTVGPDGLIILSKGYGLGGEVVELEEDGDGFAVNKIWQSNRVLKTKFNNPLILEGYTYCLSDGFLECADLETGERIWKRRGRFGHGQLMLLRNKLLIHSEYGELFLVEASPDGYNEISSLKTIEGVCWNMMCLSGKHLVVRSEVESACYALPIEPVPVIPGAPLDSEGDGIQ